jgi:hypothetical protein
VNPEHQWRYLSHPDEHDLFERQRRHQRVLHRAAHPLEGALQGNVSRRRLLHLQTDGRAAHLSLHAHPLQRHLLLDGRAEPGSRQVPDLVRNRRAHGSGRRQLW